MNLSNENVYFLCSPTSTEAATKSHARHKVSYRLAGSYDSICPQAINLRNKPKRCQVDGYRILGRDGIPTSRLTPG